MSTQTGVETLSLHGLTLTSGRGKSPVHLLADASTIIPFS